MEIFLHWPLWNVQKIYFLTFSLPKTPQIPFSNIWITLPKESITKKGSRSNSKHGKRYSFRTRINLERIRTTEDKTDTFQIMYHVWKLCKAWAKNISPFPTETRKGGSQGKYHSYMLETKENVLHIMFYKLWKAMPQDAVYNKNTCW